MSLTHSERTTVIVVGGGLVGLAAGLFLQHLGVPFILLERNVRPSPLPRSRGMHVRTMELFRLLDLESQVRAAAEQNWGIEGFGGARRGPTLLDATALDIASGNRQLETVDPSPSSFCACPQVLLEPLLHRTLEDRGGDVRFGHELASFFENKNGVVAIVRDGNGGEICITAAALVGADGGRSFVRRQLGIGTDDTPSHVHYVNLFFHADLADRMRGRTFSQCEISGNGISGLFLSKNNTTEWSFHLEIDPSDRSQTDRTDEEFETLIAAAIGTNDVPVKLLSRTQWSTSVRIARHYRSMPRIGRVFLAGDAAHIMPPWRGFNGNTGVADVHNLAWKLAAVEQDEASPLLLDSYEAERRPVAVCNAQQSLLATDFDARFGLVTAANRDAIRQLLDVNALDMRWRYPIMREGSSVAFDHPVDRLQCQIGTRFPHAWIRSGDRRVSTLDLFGRTSVVVLGPCYQGSGSRDFEASPNTWRVGVDFEFETPGPGWPELTGLPDDGALQVRPDGFIASRSDDIHHVMPPERLDRL